MTLIISCSTQVGLIQVSDRRLTSIDGRSHHDATNKALCLWCQNAHFSLAYTGIAHLFGQPIDEWLVDMFLSAKLRERSLNEVSVILQLALDEAFRRVGHAGRYPLTVDAVGYVSGRPFWASVSNEDEASTLLDTFRPRWYDLTQFQASRSFVAVTGDLRGVVAGIDQRIRKRQRRFYSQSPYRTASECVALMRAASRTPEGGTIGRNCTAVVVLPNGRFRCRAYPDQPSRVSFLPNLILGSLGLRRLHFEWTERATPKV